MIAVAGGILIWIAGWFFNARLARREPVTNVIRITVPLVFGLVLLLIWELLVRGLEVPGVILPAPTVVLVTLAGSLDLIWIDFVQTFVKGALSGFALGCGAAIATAILVDRSPFLQRGLLPVGNFLAALPIIGTAPIFVSWYGFGWESKAAVVVAMVYFPMLVNMVQGLQASEIDQQELLLTYNANYWQTLVKLRLPAAMPLAFNGLKICSTLALIGSIVAEFFGSPTYGMGFRISTEVGRLALDSVWAVIVVAAITGTAFYGIVAFVQRRVTFWHPSVRS